MKRDIVGCKLTTLNQDREFEAYACVRSKDSAFHDDTHHGLVFVTRKCYVDKLRDNPSESEAIASEVVALLLKDIPTDDEDDFNEYIQAELQKLDDLEGVDSNTPGYAEPAVFCYNKTLDKWQELDEPYYDFSEYISLWFLSDSDRDLLEAYLEGFSFDTLFKKDSIDTLVRYARDQFICSEDEARALFENGNGLENYREYKGYFFNNE